MNFSEYWVHVTRVIPANGESFTADEWGYVAGETGLGYYRPVGDETYVITHLASGFRVAGVDTEEQARVVIEQLAPLTDWTQPAKALFALPDLRTQLHQVLLAVTGIAYKSTKQGRTLVQLAKEIAERT